uniref:hypothetical protein n=1 Tax=Ningiella ruwaisensis TaxID=2364274 RepID=UPI00109FC3E0|nr:hypothetical protein [Ningiella ruwaisensis]
MLTLKGQLINTFKQPKGVNKEGNEYGGQDKVQIMGKVELPDGDSRMDMFTLTAHNIEHFKAFIGKQISIDVGVLASRNNVIFFIPKQAKPQALAS